MIDLLERLVACPSVTGEGSPLADELEPLLDELGYTVERIRCQPQEWAGHHEFSPPDLVPAEPHDGLLARAPGPPGLLLFAHTDTEPVHPGWTTDPYTLHVAGGRATGLGVADDKAGIVAILAALRAAGPLSRPPVVVLAPGKQGGALGTLPGVLAADGVSAAVYCHPAESGRGLADLKVASRGVARLRVSVPGVTPVPLEERTPISADPREGRNAVERAARLALAVHSTAGTIRSVTRIEGGGAPFEVPGTCALEVACWFADGTPEDQAADLEGLLGTLAQTGWEREHPPTVELIGLRASPADCGDSAFAARMETLVTEVTGVRPEGYGWHSASDIRFPIRCLNVPAVGLGPLAGGFYGPGEWVDLASLDQTVEVLTRLLGDYR